MTRSLAALATIVLSVALASPASAFCGFYVSGSDAQLYNNATRVSLMREGKRTVLSMQNNYEGPAEDFAMVVPVPVVLEKDDVKTLEDEIFERLDQLTSPRLVEYFEADPCGVRGMGFRGAARGGGAGFGRVGGLGSVATRLGGQVKVEAEFTVDEYDIVILSSTESTALESWLDKHDYNIPDGAAPYFKPYVQRGQYFFVAKVNMDEVAYANGSAVLSPIRFHYDADDFALPVRLGLINSRGAQDLIAFILARSQRYEVANLPNVTIPTNIPVKETTKGEFRAFYRELFDRVLEENPRAVVTEYSWNAGKCDPCPTPGLRVEELLTLGMDALPSTKKHKSRQDLAFGGVGDWTLTRLHTRYGRHTLGEDLVFRAAPGIRGGSGMPQGESGEMGSYTAEPTGRNRFQARYIIRHFWDEPVDCKDPRRGIWRADRKSRRPASANDLAFHDDEGNKALAHYVDTDDRIDGLDKTLSDYDEPAGDVVKGWGKLVESPDSNAGKSDQDPATKGANSSSSSAQPAEPPGCRSPGIGAMLFLLVFHGVIGRRRLPS